VRFPMSRPFPLAPVVVAVVFACAAILASSAGAAMTAGVGLGTRGAVAVSDVLCVRDCIAPHKARAGSTVRVRGIGMDQVSQVVFRGATAPIKVPPSRTNRVAAAVVVPAGAMPSRPYVLDGSGQKSLRSPHKLYIAPTPAAAPAPTPTATATGSAYPVAGTHEVWEGFGGARNHGGVDIGASCGTPLVAALPGTIEMVKYEPRGGNYLVLHVPSAGADLIYMHMAAPSPLAVGTAVVPGQQIGEVGDTGNASGCHLHFEYWIGEAWRGGEAVDPAPYLSQWEAAAPSPRSARR
jgi:murein DD-endopeptidase MepM/ murein hydrolase activator NlpD